MNAWICGACDTRNPNSRASCEACATSSPTATPARLAETAMADAAEARRAQKEVAAQGHSELAARLAQVVDAHLDDAAALRRIHE
ncbi:hypothetical protein ACU686_26125 [Yinghuangia aomiensis]